MSDVEGLRATVDALLGCLPLSDDGTGHVVDCGYTEDSPTCGCYTLPERLTSVLRPMGVRVSGSGPTLDRARYASDMGRLFAEARRDENDRVVGRLFARCAQAEHAAQVPCGPCVDLADYLVGETRIFDIHEKRAAALRADDAGGEGP